MTPIIQVKDLHKQFRVLEARVGWRGTLRSLVSPQYRTIHAVNGVSFNLEPGELVAYLGPNGAGKSTTLKILTGLLVPSSGDIRVDGFIPWKQRTAYVARIGAVFGQRTTLWWDLPVIDSFNLLQPMYRIPPQIYRRNLEKFCDMLEMRSFLNSPVRSLSLGQRMRADLAAALLHEPRLLFLDEPTIGLDVVAKERIRQFILDICRQGKTTILLTTHDLNDVEKLCERVMILDQGRLLFDGSLRALTERFEDRRRLVVTFAEDYAEVDLAGIQPPLRADGQATYTFDPRMTSASDLIHQLMQRFRIADLEVKRPELEATIRRIYEERLLLDD